MLSTFILVEASKFIILCKKTYLLELLNNLHNINLLFVQVFFPYNMLFTPKGNVFSLVVWSCLHLKQSRTILLASLFALNHCTLRSLTFVSTIYGEEQLQDPVNITSYQSRQIGHGPVFSLSSNIIQIFSNNQRPLFISHRTRSVQILCTLNAYIYIYYIKR